MSGFWEFVGLVALFFLVLRYLARRRASAATANGPAEDWSAATSIADARIHDIRARAAKEPLESWLLQPEPARTAGDDCDASGGRDSRSTPDRIAESVTAVLRKQIPPREETPRSWLGGLPMLPDGVDWPRGVNPEDQAKGEVPLHFIAQIACADLPPDLWGGLGPRDGWMLLFVNGNTCEADNKGVWRVLHIDELGEERRPPSDIGPLHDGVYTGSTPFTLRESIYPRWPVDIVAMPNALRVESGRSLAAPADLVERLYPGCDVAAEPNPRGIAEPFSWRCLAMAIDEAIAAMSAPDDRAAQYRASMWAKLAEPGMFESIVPTLEREEGKFWETYGAMLGGTEGDDVTPSESERRAGMRARAAERKALISRVAELIAESPTVAALLDRLEREDEAGWKGDAIAYLEQLRVFVGRQALDSSLHAAEWGQVQNALQELDREIWALAWGRGDTGLQVTVERRTLSAMTYLAPRLKSASLDVAVLYYTDAERRALIPQAFAKQLEANWRALPENRPHRLGGYHDGLQSDAQPGATDQLLLMQFAVDDALQWAWGDNGAVYCFMTPEHLTNLAWNKAEFWLECH